MLHERSNIAAFSVKHHKFREIKNFSSSQSTYNFFKKVTFTQVLWVNSGKSKQKKQDTIHFGRAIYKMLHERINITASFVEHLEVHENLTLTYALWINNDKSK